ncbi:MAG: hydrogenase maturation protease [Gammaproteobacteria bacterium]
MHNTKHAPILVFTYGNPSRGDDALGPAMFDLLEVCKQQTTELDHVDLLTDYQLQIEHALDLEQRQCVLFIDSSASANPPFEFHQLQAEQDIGYTTHAMSPSAVLSVYQQIRKTAPPPAYMLSIRGNEFGLSENLSSQANRHLQQSYRFVRDLLATGIMSEGFIFGQITP